MNRENWGSRFGFIMAAAGSAIGLGNVWRFPYVAGENGGGAFLLIYLVIVAVFGFSLAMTEIALGRATQRNPVGAFRALGGRRWMPAGFLGVAAGFVILSFYIVVAGWTLAYVGFMARGMLGSTDPAVLGARFESFIADPLVPLYYAGCFMALVVLVVSGGIGRGIERANRWLMPALFGLLLVLVVRAVTLPGAAEGLRFLLMPDFSRVTGATFGAALAQAFFSLSLGMGCLLTYGSYLSRREPIPSTTATFVGLDLLASVLAGMIVLPVVFSFGFDPGSGPGLTFVTLPAIFASMPGGAVFGGMFFLLLAIAALTSAMSILEPAVAYFVDEHGLSRRLTVAGCALVCFMLAIPSSLSFGLACGLQVGGRSFFDLMDFTATNLMLPLGALLTSLFVGWRWCDGARQEIFAATGVAPIWIGTWKLVLRFIAPAGLSWIFLASSGLI